MYRTTRTVVTNPDDRWTYFEVVGIAISEQQVTFTIQLDLPWRYHESVRNERQRCWWMRIRKVDCH